jgi:organic radical activating enzyme
MKRVQEIIPLQDTIVVDWTLGSTCNQACSYCPPNLHDGRHPYPSYDKTVALIDKLTEHYQRPCQYVISGGEPTLHPRFSTIVKHIKQVNPRNLVNIITNGSRTIRWWRQYKHLINTVNLTAHVEYADADHLVALCREFYEPGINELNVVVPMLPDRWDECIELASRLASINTGYSVTLKQLRIDFGADVYPYTPEQLEVFSTYSVFNNYNKSWHKAMPKPAVVEVDHDVVWDTGERQSLNCNKLINRYQNDLTGMHCYIGIDKIYINNEQGIQAGSWCPQGRTTFGHMDDIDNIQWPTEPLICQQPRCMNATDMRTRKHR